MWLLVLIGAATAAPTPRHDNSLMPASGDSARRGKDEALHQLGLHIVHGMGDDEKALADALLATAGHGDAEMMAFRAVVGRGLAQFAVYQHTNQSAVGEHAPHLLHAKVQLLMHEIHAAAAGVHPYTGRHTGLALSALGSSSGAGLADAQPRSVALNY